VFPIYDLNPTRTRPLVTIALIVANVLVFFAWQPSGGSADEIEFLYERATIACEVTTGDPLSAREVFTGACSSSPDDRALFPDKSVPLSVVTSMFLHGGLLHLAGNMWFLWVFGNNVEEAFGRARYAALYIAAGIVATLAFVLLNAGSTQPLVGASGAIAGVLGAYLVLYPRRPVLSLVFVAVLPVPAALFLGIWLLAQFAVGDSGVAWESHVAGFLFGMLVTAVVREPLARRLEQLHGPPRGQGG
jgi:membrane associated rhomboid family serine protease